MRAESSRRRAGRWRCRRHCGCSSCCTRCQQHPKDFVLHSTREAVTAAARDWGVAEGEDARCAGRRGAFGVTQRGALPPRHPPTLSPVPLPPPPHPSAPGAPARTPPPSPCTPHSLHHPGEMAEPPAADWASLPADVHLAVQRHLSLAERWVGGEARGGSDAATHRPPPPHTRAGAAACACAAPGAQWVQACTSCGSAWRLGSTQLNPSAQCPCCGGWPRGVRPSSAR